MFFKFAVMKEANTIFENAFILTVLGGSIFLAGCSTYQKSKKLQEEVGYTCPAQVLEIDQRNINIDVRRKKTAIVYEARKDCVTHHTLMGGMASDMSNPLSVLLIAVPVGTVFLPFDAMMGFGTNHRNYCGEYQKNSTAIKESSFLDEDPNLFNGEIIVESEEAKVLYQRELKTEQLPNSIPLDGVSAGSASIKGRAIYEIGGKDCYFDETQVW